MVMSAVAAELIAVDVDSHEMVPMHMWEEVFGSETGGLVELSHDFWSGLGEDTVVRPDIVGDVSEITEKVVWNVKGPEAPGAIDMGRRTEVLRTMGVERQL